jgi:hypothetical protein
MDEIMRLIMNGESRVNRFRLYIWMNRCMETSSTQALGALVVGGANWMDDKWK